MRRLLALWPLGLLPLPVAIFFSTTCGPSIDSKITKAQYDLHALDAALGAYKSKHGNLPTEAEGLAALINDGTIVRLPKDPWGNSYLYHPGGDAHSSLVYSAGLNQRDEAGSGDDVIAGPKTHQCTHYGVNCAPRLGQIGAWMAVALAVISLAVGIIRGGASLVRRPNNRWRGP